MYTKNTAQNPACPTVIPPAYRGTAFDRAGTAQHSEDEKKPVPCKKESGILPASFGSEELLLCTLIVILMGSHTDDLLLVMLVIIFAAGL